MEEGYFVLNVIQRNTCRELEMYKIFSCDKAQTLFHSLRRDYPEETYLVSLKSIHSEDITDQIIMASAMQVGS